MYFFHAPEGVVLRNKIFKLSNWYKTSNSGISTFHFFFLAYCCFERKQGNNWILQSYSVKFTGCHYIFLLKILNVDLNLECAVEFYELFWSYSIHVPKRQHLHLASRIKNITNFKEDISQKYIIDIPWRFMDNHKIQCKFLPISNPTDISSCH